MLSTTKMHNPSILKINGFRGSEHEQDARKKTCNSFKIHFLWSDDVQDLTVKYFVEIFVFNDLTNSIRYFESFMG